jgi:hypothetical protein
LHKVLQIFWGDSQNCARLLQFQLNGFHTLYHL